MQTTSTIFNAPRASFHAARPIILRTLWKEYRMLRGFWCGVAALALLEMYVVRALSKSGEGATLLFGSAWAAAAFYVVGAAITLFAVEREEQTDAFLRLLPRRTWGLLLGKVLAAAATAFLLAGVLLLFASPWPPPRDVAGLSVVGAVGVLQFLAWGVFMSLVCPQPLLAAVLAIAAASIGMQLAVAASSQTESGFNLGEYRDALGAQLAVVLVVGLVDAWLGRRWLEPRERRSRHGRAEVRESIGGDAVASSQAAALRAEAPRLPRRRIFGRLLWQSWREGWKPMLAAVPVGLFLLTADAAMTGLFNGRWSLGVPLLSTWLAIPALWGALVFRADQRGNRYRFLSEHAAPPRLVWAARQAAWLAPLILSCVALHLVVRAMWSRYAELSVVSALGPGESPWIYEQTREAPVQTALVLDSARRMLGRWTLLAWCGALAAYGAGQLCSMLVRSSVLAAFAAIVMAAVINWWTILAGFWRLPGWLFVAPIGVAGLAASFAVCRPWLADRRGVRFWFGATAIVAIGVALIAVAVPLEREAQIPEEERVGPFARQTLEPILLQWQVDDANARDVANRYEELAARLVSTEQLAHPVQGIGDGYDATSLDGAVSGGRAGGVDGVIAARPPMADVARRQEALRGWWAFYPAQALEANQDLFAEAAELSRAPRCRFPESNAMPGGPHGVTSRVFSELVTLIIVDAERHLDAGHLDTALERILTLRRIEAHLQQYQPVGANRYTTFAGLHGDYNGLLLRWATAPGQTSERLLRALEGLNEAEAMFPAIRESIVAEYLAIRRIVEGGDAPTFLNESGVTRSPSRRLRRWSYSSSERQPTFLETLALVANELPWERRRALAALAYMTNVKLEFADAVISGHTSEDGRIAWPPEKATAQRRRLLSYITMDTASGPAALPSPAAFGLHNDWSRLQRLQQALEECQTSLLPAFELGRRGFLLVELRTRLAQHARRALERLALSLIAYRLDHGELPETLRDLVPKYSPQGLPVDPFTLTEFEYRPRGLELPLSTAEMTGESQFIPAGTPLLWSAGPGFVELQEQRQGNGRYSNSERVETLAPTSPYGPDEGPIVLPIPEAAKEPDADEPTNDAGDSNADEED